MIRRIFPRHKACPDQAGFIRRGLAFSFDATVIAVLSLLIYLVFFEIKAKATGEPGIIAQVSQAIKEGSGVSIRTKEDKSDERIMKQSFLKIIKERIPEKEYELAKEMSVEEFYNTYEKEFIAAGYKHRFIYVDVIPYGKIRCK